MNHHRGPGWPPACSDTNTQLSHFNPLWFTVLPRSRRHSCSTLTADGHTHLCNSDRRDTSAIAAPGVRRTAITHSRLRTLRASHACVRAQAGSNSDTAVHASRAGEVDALLCRVVRGWEWVAWQHAARARTSLRSHTVWPRARRRARAM